MTMGYDFRFTHFEHDHLITAFTTSWSAPSNIALVKYWGKKEVQIPCNPSVSFTLRECRTQTTIQFDLQSSKKEEILFSIQYEGQPAPSFAPKITEFLKRIKPYAPFLTHYHLTIDTSNTFPHSSGIASSASSMAALAAGIVALEEKLNPSLTKEEQTNKCSFLARLGSGSAARSVEGPIILWGNHPESPNSSDLFGVKLAVYDNVFASYHDTVLLVDQGQKIVSSTVGHNLMHNHLYASTRFEQARENYSQLLKIFSKGDLVAFVDLVEQEALSLHAMMLTSSPSYLLMQPNTLRIIEEVRAFRKKSGLHLAFTLDAGANVHLLYPDAEAEKTRRFIENNLRQYCQDNALIHDRIGMGIKNT